MSFTRHEDYILYLSAYLLSLLTLVICYLHVQILKLRERKKNLVYLHIIVQKLDMALYG